MADVSSNWNAIMQYSFIRIFANDGTIDAESSRRCIGFPEAQCQP